MARSQKVAKPYSPLATAFVRLCAVVVALFTHWISGEPDNVVCSQNSTQHFGSECSRHSYDPVSRTYKLTLLLWCGPLELTLGCSLVSWLRRMTW
jgi:hypothetical protein